MKKILSLTLAVLMIVSAFVMSVGAAMTDDVWHPDNKKWDAISRDGVVARFAIGADIHFDYYHAGEKNQYVYNALKQIGGVDAYLIAGDLTHYASHDNYKNLMENVNKYTKKNVNNPDATGDSVAMTILSMGNHEYWDDIDGSDKLDLEKRFTDYTSQQTDALYWISGVPVIKLSPDNIASPRGSSTEIGGCYDESEDFLKNAYAEIDAKGYKGLIIMIAHHRTTTDGSSNDYWSENMMNMMKAHPNTMIFTGHSHTWIGGMKEFILQDGGFTHVRAGSLGNNYGGIGSNYINPETGKTSTPLSVSGDSNCSFVLVDILENGNARLQRIDLAKGEYMYQNDPAIVRPGVLTDYLYDSDTAGYADSYGAGSVKPSFPAGGKVTVTDKGNNSSINVSFPEAIPATSLAKDFVSEYRIRVKTPVLDENGEAVLDANGAPTYTFVKNGTKDYFRVANYRAKADEGKPWNVTVHGLAWDTDYTVEVRAYSTYGKATGWTDLTPGTVNVGHGELIYPVEPVIDFDASYGNVTDGAGHKLLTEPTIVKEAEINGQKAINLLGIGGVPYSYEFYEEDYLKIRNAFTVECYFSASNTVIQQCLLGGWDSTHLGLKINGEKLYLRANFAAANAGQEKDYEIAGVDIERDTWYHAVVTYDSNTVRMYLNGELAVEESGYAGGLADISYYPEAEEDDDSAAEEAIVRSFCVGAGRYDGEGDPYLMQGCKINKASLYAGVMTDEDVKTAYKVTTTALPFTDVEDGWYIDSVEYAYATGLMNGSSATTFSPSVKTNRAMIVQMLYNLEGKPAVDKSNNPFTDVPDTWYTDAVLWAYQNGVTTGTSATTFAPDALVTREQVAVFLYRYMRDYKKADVGEGADLSAYPDADSISDYTDFNEAVAWANANGIIGGKKNGEVVTLSPLDQAMRSEVAKMFVSFAKKY